MLWHLGNALTGTLGPTVEPVAWTYGDPLTGAGVGELQLPVPADVDDREDLRALLDDPNLSVLPRWADGRWSHWGGPVSDPPTVSDDGRLLTIAWTDWRGYFYSLYRRGSDYVKGDIEQADAIYDLLIGALDDAADAEDDRTGPGTPMITIEQHDPTGIARQVTVRAWETSIADAIDEKLVNTADGLEWWSTVETTTNKRVVRPKVNFTYPQRHSIIVPLRLDLDPGGGNIITYSPPTRRQPVSRVAAVGEANGPDRLVAWDDDPELADGTVLLRETVIERSGATRRDTLSDAAADEREALGRPESMTVTLTGDNPECGTFHVGDRVSVLIDDGWTQVDLPAARILNAEYTGAGSVCLEQTLTLDLVDAFLTADEIDDV